MADDILSAGLDVSGFSPEKKKVLQEFVEIFQTLEKYDGRKFSPLQGGGLSEFNKSVTDTDKSIEKLSKKWDELSLSIDAYRKQLDQTSITEAKLNASTSEQAKLLAEKKVALREAQKALLQDAEANNESVKAKKAQAQADKEAAKSAKDAAAAKKQASKEALMAQKQADRESAQSAKEAEKQKRQAEKERAEEQKRLHKENLQRLKEIENAMKNEARTAEANANKMAQLRNILKNQQQAYVNNSVAFGFEDERTKRSLSDVRETQGIINALNEDMKNTAGNASAAAANVGKIWSAMRMAAYILPSLGIAGIFNLVFEGIGKVLEQMQLFNSELEKVSNYETKISNGLSEQLSVLVQVVEKMKELDKLDRTSYERESAATNRERSFGVNQKTILDYEVADLENRLLKASGKVSRTIGTTDSSKLNDELAIKLNDVKIYTKQVKDAIQAELLNNQIEAKIPRAKRVKVPQVLRQATKDEIQAYKEAGQAKLNLANEEYNILKSYVDDYYSALDDLEKKKAEREKFNREQDAKAKLEATKAELSTKIKAQEVILTSEASSQKQKIDALNKILDLEKDISLAETKFITDNISTNPKEAEIANKKFEEDKKKRAIDFGKDLFGINEEYRQRYLKATTEINKDAVDKEAIRNEMIFKDETKSLDERLGAYAMYIVNKQKLQDLEYERDKEKLGQTPEEKAALISNRDKNKASIEANSAKQIYDIVTSFSRMQLKEIIDANRLKRRSNDEEYANALDNLSKKKLNYKQYLNGVRALENLYKSKEASDDEVDLISQMSSLRNARMEMVAKRDMSASKANLYAPGKLKDEELAKNLAFANSVVDIDKQLQLLEDEKNRKKLQKHQATLNQMLQYEKMYAEGVAKIAQQAFDLGNTLINSYVQRKSLQIQREREMENEKNEAQATAIERSTLNEKNKIAYEIQLEQQKLEHDKALQREERNLKRQQAIYDRGLALARIAWNTQVAITSHLWNPALILQDIIWGSLAAATVLANDIPAYEHGTQGVPHEGGPARIGEKGKAEVVKEPNKPAYIVNKDQIVNLPKGTEVFPINDTPQIIRMDKDNNWEQTMMIVSAIKKQKKEIKNIIKPVTKIDMGWEIYKNRIING